MKIIAAACLLTLLSFTAFAQNISLNTLIRINEMQPAGVNDYFNSTHQFELFAADNSKGYVLSQYKNKQNDITKREIISTGAVSKTSTGEVLHQISYWTNYYWYIEGLRKQTETAGYYLKLKAHDSTHNIWEYENDEFIITFRINKDESQGTVDINQKHSINTEAF